MGDDIVRAQPKRLRSIAYQRVASLICKHNWQLIKLRESFVSRCLENGMINTLQIK